MKRRVRLATAARRDIVNALRTSRQEFGERQAADHDELVQLALRAIAADPTGLLSRPREDLARSARTIHIGRRGRKARHLLVYIVEPNGDVHVLRLLHDAMNLKRHLSELESPECPDRGAGAE